MFKTFPEFSEISLVNKREYEELTKGLPPISDLSFATLMIWWNSLNCLRMSQLNGNIILSYWLPGDEYHSGLSLIGTNEIDETICIIFDHQRSQDEKPILVNVPELVVGSIHYPELFCFKGDRDHDECIIPVSRIYPLSDAAYAKQVKVRRFLDKVDSGRITVRSLDLSTTVNKWLLINLGSKWRRSGNLNGNTIFEAEALQNAVVQAQPLGIKNICLYIDGILHAFCLFQLPAQAEYVIVNHLEVSNEFRDLYDFMLYVCSRWFYEHGVKYINLEQDLGVTDMRAHRLTLSPVNFFRKYRIEPR